MPAVWPERETAKSRFSRRVGRFPHGNSTGNALLVRESQLATVGRDKWLLITKLGLQTHSF
jgi:hypothetical protein